VGQLLEASAPQPIVDALNVEVQIFKTNGLHHKTGVSLFNNIPA